jgi:DNA-binding MarR family transcriptional regulator
MQADGLVRRVPYPGDKRRQLVEITAEGRALQKRMWPAYAAAIERHIGSKIGCADAQKLAELLGRLSAAGGEPALCGSVEE